VFDLTDAIGYRQKDKALQIVENMIENEESIIMIVSLLSNLFFTLWRLDTLRRKNISAYDLKSSHMNDILPFLRDKYITFLRNYNQGQIEKALRQLYVCDSRAKLSMAKDVVLGVSLITGIMR
jgi:DNA polymerase III delta subunit